MMNLTAVIIDRHAGFRNAVRKFMGGFSDFSRVFDYAHIDDACDDVCAMDSAVVIVDAELIEGGGGHSRIIGRKPRILIVTATFRTRIETVISEHVPQVIVSKSRIFDDLPAIIAGIKTGEHLPERGSGS